MKICNVDWNPKKVRSSWLGVLIRPLLPQFLGALNSQVLENAGMENASTKQDILQGWKVQVLKTQVRFAGLEYASTQNVSIPVNTNCGDYNGTPIACQMSISQSGFLTTRLPK